MQLRRRRATSWSALISTTVLVLGVAFVILYLQPSWGDSIRRRTLTTGVAGRRSTPVASVTGTKGTGDAVVGVKGGPRSAGAQPADDGAEYDEEEEEEAPATAVSPTASLSAVPTRAIVVPPSPAVTASPSAAGTPAASTSSAVTVSPTGSNSVVAAAAVVAPPPPSSQGTPGGRVDPLAPRPGVDGFVAQMEPPTTPGAPPIITARSFLKHTKTHRHGPQNYGPGERAIITMASNAEAARMAIVLVQSLRDVGTDPNIEIVVLAMRGAGGSPECHDPAWKKAAGREGIHCSGPETIAEEIISPPYVASLRKLGATVRVVNPIPRTKYTEGIAGGPQSFWGMSLNRMMIFNFTEYKKLVWMDADTIVFKNMDDLFDWPTFTSSITHACCSQNGPGQPSGGLWVLEPSHELALMFWRMMEAGVPEYNNDGTPQLDADGVTHLRGTWRQSDMMLVRHAFVAWNRNRRFDQLWPKVLDNRHGYPAGMRDLPLYRVMSDAEFKRATWNPWMGAQMPEGLDQSMWDGESIIWHGLSIHYDQCIPNCDCLPWRNNLTMAMSLHLSCIPGDTVSKAGHYETEAALMAEVNGAKGTNCLRHYYRDIWYEKFVRAHGRLPPPYWEDPTGTRTRPTNMSALMNPPTWIYDPDWNEISRITGWGR